MPTSVSILLRIVATFVANALAVIGSGAIVGIDLYLAALMGGILAVAKVVEKLSIAFLEDGKLTKAEINAAFRTSLAVKGVDENGEPTTTTKPKRG